MLRSIEINIIVYDPSDKSTIYAGTRGCGIIKSTDGGESWSVLNKDMTKYGIKTLSIDPENPATLYVGTYGIGNGGVFKSTDGGESWKATELVRDNISAIAIDSIYPNIIYASDEWRIFKSEDAGESWFEINNGFESYGISSLAVDPVSTETVYAGGADFFVGYRDGEKNESKKGHILKSTDGGENWSVIGEGLICNGVNTIIIDPMETNTLYAGTHNAGVFKSANGGENWSKINKNLTNPMVFALAVDSSNNRIFAGTAGSGVFRYDNSLPSTKRKDTEAAAFGPDNDK